MKSGYARLAKAGSFCFFLKHYFNLGSIFAVSASSANPRAAWEFVKYVNSDAFSKLKSKTMSAEQESPSPSASPSQ
ncbi:hypothetical protein [Cohnella hongkongensis]|uniref:Extracellular solute-binding protein n=1 Tax=Cohnella hongkongensis TaxID=178337 RepID=A0ABV9FJ08_9BACL